MKIKLISTVVAFWVLSQIFPNVYVMTNTPKPIKLIELSGDELAELNIIVKDYSLNYIEQKYNFPQEQENNTVKYTKISIVGMSINIMNYNDLTPPEKSPSPRLAVNAFKSGSTAYFARRNDLEKITEAKNGETEQTIYSYADANSLVGIHIKIDNPDPNVKQNNIYLWYEPTEEFISKLPERYKNELKKELNSINAENNENRFTNIEKSNTNLFSDVILYPNPANIGYANLKFSLSEDKNVSLTIYDISGKLVKTVISNENVNSGENNYKLELSDFPAGMYLVCLTAESGENVIQRLIITN